MTVAELDDRVAVIMRYSDRRDFEAASGELSRLWKDVLQAIAAGEAENPAELAAFALLADTIKTWW